MFRKFLSLLFLLVFFSTSILETKEFLVDTISSGKILQLSQNTADASSANVKNEHCEDCESDGCSDTNGCCVSYCTCTHSFLIGRSEYLHIPEPATTKADGYYYNHYRSPFLDPALKPPLFS